MSSKTSHEAIDWFVWNESEPIADEAGIQRWEVWCAEPDNRAQYVGVMQLVLDILELAPPELVSRRELLKDVAAGEGGCN